MYCNSQKQFRLDSFKSIRKVWYSALLKWSKVLSNQKYGLQLYLKIPSQNLKTALLKKGLCMHGVMVNHPICVCNINDSLFKN